jgi:flagellar FliL protein
MAETDVDSEISAQNVAAAQKKKKLILLGGVLAALLLVSGVGTWLSLHFLGGGTTADEPVAAAAAKPAKPAKAEALYLQLDPNFLTNFTVDGRQHYLQLSIAVLARSADAIAHVQEHMPLIRNRVVMLLSGESFDNLQTDAGRVQLQAKLLAAIQAILQQETGKPGIEQVLFTNFVMT